MIDAEESLAEEYLAGWCEHLVTVEMDLFAIEKGGVNVNAKLIDRVFRTMHSVRGAGFFGLVKISDLAQHTEAVLALIRSREMAPTRHRVGVLLRAAARLHELVQDHGASNQADISEIVAALVRVREDHYSSSSKSRFSVADQAHRAGRLRLLLAEDDFASRLVLQSFLSRFGDCDIAVNGAEAVEAVRSAFEREQRYDMICMDLMMPEMDGREAVRQVRALEEARGILSPNGAKIIMTTAVGDVKEVIRCFLELCDSYLLKPIDLNELLNQMRFYRLVQ